MKVKFLAMQVGHLVMLKELAHLGHQGIVKTKQLIRDKVWFPGIDKLTEDKVNKTLRSVHFDVVVVELINCKCGGIVRNQKW